MSNFNFLKEIDEELFALCLNFEGKLKTQPTQAAIEMGKAFDYFVTAVCRQNEVAFMRPKFVTSINMLAMAFEYGAINQEEKAILDEIRYTAHKAATGEKFTYSKIFPKAHKFFEVITRYYEVEQKFNNNIVAINGLVPKKFIKRKTSDYNAVFLCASEKGNYYVVVQYTGQKEYLKKQKQAKFAVLYKKEVVEEGNDISFFSAQLPEEVKNMEISDVENFDTKKRTEIVLSVLEALIELHENELVLDGFNLDDILIGAKNVYLLGAERAMFSHQGSAESDYNAFLNFVSTILRESESLEEWKTQDLDAMYKKLKKGMKKYKGENLAPLQFANFEKEQIVEEEPQEEEVVEEVVVEQEEPQVEPEPVAEVEVHEEVKEEPVKDFDEIYKEIFGERVE